MKRCCFIVGSGRIFFTERRLIAFRGPEASADNPASQPSREQVWEDIADAIVSPDTKATTERIYRTIEAQFQKSAVSMSHLRAADRITKEIAMEKLNLSAKELQQLEPKTMNETYRFVMLVIGKLGQKAAPISPKIHTSSVPKATSEAASSRSVSASKKPDLVVSASKDRPSSTSSVPPLATTAKSAPSASTAPQLTKDLVLADGQTDITPNQGGRVWLFEGIELQHDLNGDMNLNIDPNKWTGDMTMKNANGFHHWRGEIELGKTACALIKNQDGSYVIATNINDTFAMTPIRLGPDSTSKPGSRGDTEKSKELRIVLGDRSLTNVCYTDREEVRRLMLQGDISWERILAHASRDIRENKVFALEAIQEDPRNILYLDEFISYTSEILTAAMKQAPVQTLKILQQKGSRLSKNCDFLVQFTQNPDLLGGMDDKTREDFITGQFAEKIIKNNPLNLRWITDRDTALWCICRNQDIKNVAYLNKNLKSDGGILFTMAKNFGAPFRDAFLNTDSVNGNITPEEVANIKNETLLAILKMNPLSYQYCSEEQRGNYKIAREVVKIWPPMLRYVPVSVLTKDYDLPDDAQGDYFLPNLIREDPRKLQFLPDGFYPKEKDNIHTKKVPRLIRNLSSLVRNDERALEFIPPDLRGELRPVKNLQKELGDLGTSLRLGGLIMLEKQNIELLETRILATTIKNAIGKLTSKERVNLRNTYLFLVGSKDPFVLGENECEIPCGATEIQVLQELKKLAKSAR